MTKKFDSYKKNSILIKNNTDSYKTTYRDITFGMTPFLVPKSS